MGGLAAGSYVFGDIGLSVNTINTTNIEPASGAWFVSDEVKFANKLLMGPKVGIWVGGGLAFGLNMIYYTDFSQGSLVFRPEVGMGFSPFKLVYGYNAKLTNTRFEGINRNLVEVVYCFKLKKLKSWHPFDQP
ncbi:hypothetical protein GCM10011511_25330 [Puia dinghuensis]|uniref:Uncharacterized protein n=2 Tax=Puia dinghuensis TaxID=1792502 RepID=A0A8J2UD67_9BACT|nr:hypothetical protein GCM10011511_25330 [Puia dinghuensis]